MLALELLAYPGRAASEIDDGPDHGAVGLNRVENAVRKDLAQQAMITSINNPVNARRYFQPFDVSPKANCKVITETRLLGS